MADQPAAEAGAEAGVRKGAGTLWRAAAVRCFRGGAAGPGSGGVLRGSRDAADRRLWADRRRRYVRFNPVDAPRAGSIGKALPGVEMRIADEGELLIRGPYAFERVLQRSRRRRPNCFATAGCIPATSRTIDAEGYSASRAASKELIVSSNGKKIFPARVESLFKFEPLISQVLLAGDGCRTWWRCSPFIRHVAETIPGAKESGRAAARERRR